MLFSLEYLIAFIFPSIPRLPKPPGTNIPLEFLNISFKLTSSFSNDSESIQLIFTFVLYLYPACLSDSATDKYASCSSTYLPTSAISISLFKLSTVFIKSSQYLILAFL